MNSISFQASLITPSNQRYQQIQMLMVMLFGRNLRPDLLRRRHHEGYRYQSTMSGIILERAISHVLLGDGIGISVGYGPLSH
jgi:hypothetical protein